MIPKQAIEKAIEGGYLGGKAFASYRKRSQQVVYEEEDYVLPKLTKTIPEIALDPTFWQALGKVLGWGEHPIWGKVGRDGYINVWQSYAMDFYDLILTGGDLEAYWNELLKENL